jgi:chemotaxis protein CheD
VRRPPPIGSTGRVRLPRNLLPQVFLSQGELHCTAEPTMVTTVLGSCVAVCLSDRARGLGGINHFLLPHCDGDQLNLRYGDVAIDRLLDGMLSLGARVGDLEAKVFGGAAVMPMNAPENNVGTRNVEVAMARLRSLGITVVARRTGGSRGLSVRLFTATGDVLIRAVRSVMGSQADQLLPVHDTGRNRHALG